MQEIDSVSHSEGEEIGLRLFAGQRSATVASSDLSDEALGMLVDRCLAMAKEAPEELLRMPTCTQFCPKSLVMYKPSSSPFGPLLLSATAAYSQP